MNVFSFTNKDYRLCTPLPDDLKAAWQQQQFSHFPYWGKCWPAAVVLAEFLSKNSFLVRDKLVIELASGLGLPSLVASDYAKKVVTTDFLQDPLSFVDMSVRENGISNIETKIINWHAIPKELTADVVLLSDVNYNPDDFEALDRLIDFFLQQNTLIILSTPQRIVAKTFVEKWLRFEKMQETFFLTDDLQVSVLVLCKNEKY